MKNQEIKLLTLAYFVANYGNLVKSTQRFLTIRFRSSQNLRDEDLEDNTSETMLVVLEQLKKSDIVLTCKPQSFIASIACNKTIDMLRKRSRFVIVNELPKDAVAEGPLSLSIESEKETLRLLIDNLPFEDQILLEKRYPGVKSSQALSRMTLDEINRLENDKPQKYGVIATELGIKEGALRTRMTRLLDDCKVVLQKTA